MSTSNYSIWTISIIIELYLSNIVASWNGTPSNIDDQFLDPAIISGCLSSDNTNSPGGLQQNNWLKSFHHLADNDMSNKQSSSSHMLHSQSHPHGFRSANMSHSRMPFAQNLHMSQPGVYLPETCNENELSLVFTNFSIVIWDFSFKRLSLFVYLYLNYCVNSILTVFVANSSGWPPLQQHNPPPGFPSAFRSSSQNPRLATLES